MTSQHATTTFALFGSVARGDHDAFSDRDLLIVSDDDHILATLKSNYNTQGWSCTGYTWSRLQHAADHGSLFVQHLKQESKIIRDPQDRLAHLLANYTTNASYQCETEGAESLLGELTQTLPQCEAGPMWTLDVLSVGFRSLAVAKLADEGIYAFANSDILNGLIRLGSLHQTDASRLWALRKYKSLYRRGNTDNRVGWIDTYDLIRLIDHVFRLGLSLSRVDTRDIVECALAGENSLQWSTGWYVRCRRVESALWMLKPLQHQHIPEFLQKRQELFKMVKAPNSYGWRFSQDYAAIQQDLSDLAHISAV